jgi:hypothetical protein
MRVFGGRLSIEEKGIMRQKEDVPGIENWLIDSPHVSSVGCYELIKEERTRLGI